MSMAALPANIDSVRRRNNVNVTGRGTQPMLFAHGFGCDQNMWSAVAPAFYDDYKVVLMDHVGAGQSDLSAYDRQKYASLNGYAQDVLEVCDALQLRDVVFVGHSVSSMIGVLAAGAQPQRFAKLVLVSPSPCYINDGDYVGGFSQQEIYGLIDFLDSNHLGWSAAMAPVIMGNADRPELGKKLENSFCQTDPEIARHFARVTFLSDNREDLRRVKIPSLILQCADDAIAPSTVGDYLHRRLAGSKLVLMKATGHCPNVSAPAETIEAMRSFLAGDTREDN